MVIHPFIFFLLTLIFSIPVIIVGTFQLKDLHKRVFNDKKKEINFYLLNQNHPMIREEKSLASPKNNNNDQEGINWREMFNKLYIMFITPPLNEKNNKSKGKS